MFEKIPAEMKRLHQWVCWQLRDMHDSDGGPRKTKVPPRTDGRPASTTNPKDWVTFSTAVRALRLNEKFSGIGFVFTRDSGLVGIDLDKCRHPETGETEPWAKAILVELDTYTELSQSGQGWHAIVKGSLPPGGNRKGRVEMYDHDRYFVMTGKRASNSSRSEGRQFRHRGWRASANFEDAYALSGNGRTCRAGEQIADRPWLQY